VVNIIIWLKNFAMLLKPINADVTWIFQCPIWEGEIWVNQDMTKIDGYAPVCCGRVHPIEKIIGAEVKPKYATLGATNTMEDKVIESMRQMGITKVRAKRLIREAIDKHGFFERKEDLLKAALAELETDA
jgi:hypothetical protein